MAIKANPNGMTMAYTLVNVFIAALYLLFTPMVWKEEAKPCNKWRAKSTKEITYNPVLIGE
jgi:hypothetical protein